MNKLTAFVYVSTYATQAHCARIEEDVSSMVPGLEETVRRKGIKDLKWMVDFCRPHADDAPNSYTFSKNIAEVMVKVVSEQEGFRTVILRPPVVIPPEREPHPAFGDDMRQGIVSLFLSLYLGLLAILVCDGNKIFICTHADVLVNAILVSASDISRDPELRFRVLNVCGNGGTFNELITKAVSAGKRFPSMNTLRPLHEFRCSTSNNILTKMEKLVKHYLFAVVLDACILLTGGKAM